ncbi:MAG TPA: DUF5996 family protein [Bryobacteraceae bacterium]|nr:DUF5996 family protein [Bryobacteraceae bacterium]HOQ44620.1 DUF5996 family protein [Bryobacteraceae bacterium]HPQ14865.1 DUF5996 family protein [Bryobacteraceae bacterium]HPU73852.1 DUF5996 family protein [Bryobacteraceae bacterium]
MSKPFTADGNAWPPLPLAEWKDTCETLHMWTQIVGKVRMRLSPPLNHWWHVPLYVTARGLTTSPIPYGWRVFEINFDFIDHYLAIETSDGMAAGIALKPMAVADFYRQFMERLNGLGIDVQINATPNEVPEPIPFAEDRIHKSYDPAQAHRFWRALVSVDTVFKEFRARYVGKCSPVHFFWGSFDLAVSRFSGQRAPEKPEADSIYREAYSHSVSSAGFWPGSGEIQDAAFYAYTVPAPEGLAEARVQPEQAFYHKGLGEFLLMYDDVRRSSSPRDILLAFLQSTYEAGADLAGWNRKELERELYQTA